ncbi:unnamed protein product [Acanthoscelides obtectus]|uniref:Uncharacterized protein n=1 Tax=Acanthoscelides obtectus TaxID=200917 RepID=A0A9P0LRW9_ACAOB|nr:unnamed protein product [Acanthoscelides obtectus]CAK1621375.1 hypothetical protein AOBTE_LOCUS920 [Acanthoscelides obtectus]
MVPKLTGQILAQTVKHFIKTNNLDSKLCVGIGTDTCNLMLGEHKGAVMELQKCLPNAKKPMRKSCLESFDFKKQQCPSSKKYCVYNEGIVQERRANSEKHFRILFASIMKTHETLDIEPTVPRITSRQMNRPNIVTSDKENHYRLNLYVPLLDNTQFQHSDSCQPSAQLIKCKEHNWQVFIEDMKSDSSLALKYKGGLAAETLKAIILASCPCTFDKMFVDKKIQILQIHPIEGPY